MSDIEQISKQESYRVLARKYRPDNFEEVIGQEALIRTLRNAIDSGRIHHAYMLTGIRGTGKTTTARLIARALNYTGPDGKAGPTTGPTADCEICQTIAEGRHPDVMEMDAASRTGVEGIREILDGVRYAPASARYKVYIIDEVHMLSTSAFNALLKTLEEPPPHVIFIFATTEIRKVPVTVLSRCQRFDLRRVDVSTLADYYAEIAKKEGVEVDLEAMSLIARAADGSVRDGLSLLDQAIALAGEKITGQQIQDMLGLSDRNRVLDVLEHVLKGECPEALTIFGDMYKSGSDPAVVIEDMLDFTHLLTRYRAVPNIGAEAVSLAPGVKDRIVDLSGKLSMATLGRAWQILLKGLKEVNAAPNPQAAAEMVVIRLTYAADLPDPADLIRRLTDESKSEASAAPVKESTPVESARTREPEPVARKMASGGGRQEETVTRSAPELAVVSQPETGDWSTISSIDEMEEALRAHGFHILAGEVYQYVSPVTLSMPQFDFYLTNDIRREFSSDLAKALQEITSVRWMLSISNEPGAPSLAQRKKADDDKLMQDVTAHPVVKNVLELFPGTKVSIKRDNE